MASVMFALQKAVDLRRKINQAAFNESLKYFSQHPIENSNFTMAVQRKNYNEGEAGTARGAVLY